MIIYVVMALAIFASGFGTAWKIEEWRHTAEQAAVLKAQVEAQAAEDARAAATAARFEAKLQAMRAAQAKNTQDIINEVQSNRVYTDCVVPESGRVLRDHSIDEVNRSLGFAATVPANSEKPRAADDGRAVQAGPAADPAVRGMRGAPQGAAGTAGTPAAAGPPR